jgi:thiol:disulfide interchange protein DsbD
LTTFRLLLAALATALFAAPVAALAQDVPADGPHTKVSLIAETKTIAPGQKLRVALVQEIEKGWHTYWVNPGDSGLPTTNYW